jgi:hypothetical protein
VAALTKKRKGTMPGAGFGMIGLVISLAIVAVGGAVGGTMLLGGGGSSDTGLGTGAGSPANKAYDIVAETTLETAESAVQTVATTTGYGTISAQSLAFDEPSVHFTQAASNADTTVSVATSGGQAATPGDTSIQAVVGGASSGGGSVTLAAFSQSTSGTGSCLYVWMTTGATWFGAEPGETACTAVALSTAPAAGPPTSATIGWSSTTFPTP